MNIYKYIFCSHHQRIITVCGVVEMLYNALTFMMRPLVLAIVVNMLWGLFTQRSSHVICDIKGHAMLLVRYWYALRICQMFLHCLIWILDFLLFCFITSPMYYIPWSLVFEIVKNTTSQWKVPVASRHHRIWISTSSFIHNLSFINVETSDWVIKFNGLSSDGGHRGPYNAYKSCNHNLYIGIIILPHIDNSVYRLQLT